MKLKPMIPHKKKTLKAIDFFCGAGGMTQGMIQSGIDVLAGIDIASDCKQTYEINNSSTYIETDITSYTADDLKEATGILKNDDSLVFIGCSPCQYWTKIRTNKSKSKMTKDLLDRFKYFVHEFLPGYIVIENVPGLCNSSENRVLRDFKQYLSDSSYVFDDGIINGNDYGVPQNRRRYLFVATRLSEDIRLPEAEKSDDLTVRNFIGRNNGFKKIPAGHKDETDYIHSSANLSKQNIQRMKLTKRDGGTRHCWKDNPALQINAYKGRDDIFGDVYARMWWDKPAPTITTRFNSFSNGRFGHPEENRAISLREGATLQTFPKDYIFKGSNNATIARQIGNAVPPELARRIGIDLIRSWKNTIVQSKSKSS
ncbi:DNA cytosine methyltransferase [Methanococcoides sp. NM1]|uniref:DNA cytosine methyltransferase n=1 Tax=Methanococcoides sp. NM1 TaxID=1201013 RepID=UPI001AEFC514|nr:DNA cytosine methyltransferase [Methanococcoides sp. NM1]